VTSIAKPSILSLLHGRASLRPDDVAFTYTNYEVDWAGVPESLTWSQLYRRVLNVAREISLHGAVAVAVSGRKRRLRDGSRTGMMYVRDYETKPRGQE
jgi:acyl-CoA synthetase (AMP-forming)/AMP-acid ligase II